MTNEPRPTPVKQSFDSVYTELERLVEAHRRKWVYTSIVEWCDIKQRIIIRLWKQYNRLYDPAKGPLSHWANKTIKHELLNCNRDLGLQRLQRPCVGGGKNNGKSCIYNTGDRSCSYTPSKTQCAECPVYHDWEKTREPQWHIKSTVTLENHAQEVYSIPGDSADVAGSAKEWVDTQMLSQLTRWEGRVYRLLYIRYVSPSAASKELIESSKKRKRPLGPMEQTSYQAILGYQRRFKAMMMGLLKQGGYIQ